MTTVKLRYADYARLEDDKRYELIDGELHMVLAPNRRHQSIAMRLVRILDRHLEPRHLGQLYFAPFDVILSEHDVLQPDLLFVRAEREDVLVDEGARGAPDLVIEILSPGTAKRDRGAKTAIYHRAGVRELWIVDPDAERIEVFLPTAAGLKLDALYQGEDGLRSTVLPDLELRAAQAFADG